MTSFSRETCRKSGVTLAMRNRQTTKSMVSGRKRSALVLLLGLLVLVFVLVVHDNDDNDVDDNVKTICSGVTVTDRRRNQWYLERRRAPACASITVCHLLPSLFSD